MPHPDPRTPPAPRDRARRLPRGLEEEITRTARRAAIDDARKWMLRYLEAVEQQRPAAALRALERVREAAPRSPTVRQALGRMRYQAGRWHDAAQELLAYRRFTGDHRADPMIAESYRKLGRPQRAIEFLEELPRAGLRESVRIEAEVARARAYHAMGRADVARSVLESATSTAESPRARAAYARELSRLFPDDTHP